MHLQLFIISFLLQIVSVVLYLENNDTQISSTSRVLSRKKRYLVFPEGSSFQLVYCLTMPTYGMGSIFTMGLTAALAWELPHEPIDLKNFKKTENSDNAAEKRVDKPSSDNVKKVYKPPVTDYHKPWIRWGMNTQPQYQYITNQSFQEKNQRETWKYQRRGNGRLSGRFQEGGNEYESDWDHLPAYKNEYLYRKHGDVHRRTRRELFTKIEKFFDAQNKDGKACLLKALCEVNQTNGSEKGTFVEEILKAIFTWIPADEKDTDHEHYDNAAMHKGNCTEKFPSCKQSVWNPFF